jgi:phenylalanine-4-hydroxylase
MERIPKHLQRFVVDQEYEKYNWRDQAVWRYVMRKNRTYLADIAHESYIGGLAKTGISIDTIPSLEEMNRILNQIGWSAVCVSGFIPPEAFMEFQGHKILVIAADIRHLNHIEYTAAPDILHEAAGHAPIISNPVYADYLQAFGMLGLKAFSSARDHQLYQAIRELSDAKALHNIDTKQTKKLENRILEIEQQIGDPSEMALLRNLHWWTVEYGLVGNIKNPKIYGAGLLSSLGESQNAMLSEVRKIPYSIEAMHYSFDITKMQPQLFVSPDFEHLHQVLNQFSEQMAYKKGGAEAVLKAIESENISTVELSSGIQISGRFSRLILNAAHPVYLNTKGSTALAYKGKLIENHGVEQHKDGFGTPIGKLKNCNKPIRFLDSYDLERLSIKIGKKLVLEFLSGLRVDGVLKQILRREDYIVLMSFEECTVTYQNEKLFLPEWGVYDMAIGEQVVSAFNGSFDPLSFLPSSKVQVTYPRTANALPEALNNLYKQIRDCREKDYPLPDIRLLLRELKTLDPQDWLLAFEILELLKDNMDDKALVERYIRDIKL